jgi:cytochrome c6
MMKLPTRGSVVPICGCFYLLNSIKNTLMSFHNCARVSSLRGGVGILFAVFVSSWMSMYAYAAEVDKAQIALGRAVFTKLAAPPCGLCHTLTDAGTTGQIGPKLDELKPDASQVAAAVREGTGAMPPFAGKLTEEQIRAVAYYVSQAVRKSN